MEKKESCSEEAPDELDGGVASCVKRKQNDEDDVIEEKQNRFNKEVVLSKSSKYSEFYSMNFTFSGYLIIFAHFEFIVGDAKDKPRPMAQKDIDMLSSTFSRLNFRIRIYTDCRLSQIREIIRKASNMDFSDYGSLAIAVSTHGYSDGICAMDAVYQADEELIEPFKNNRTLYGKPKMFFLGACRGDGLDDGVTLLAPVETDGSQLEEYRIPQEADILLVYATMKDYTAFHNSEYGSNFYIFLTEALDDFAANRDLMTILTLANQRLSIEFTSKNHEKKQFHNKKQCMCILNTLTRLIKFKLRKNRNDNNNYSGIPI